MGLWASNSNIGNIIGLQLAHTILIVLEWRWEYCFVLVSLFLLTMSILDLLYLDPYPEKIGMDFEQDRGSVDTATEKSCS
jgi:sugar phosphate permease